MAGEEKKVNEAADEGANPLLEAVRKVLLASIGAVALAQDEIEDFVNKLVERGEIAEKDGKKLVRDLKERRKKESEKAEAELEAAAAAGARHLYQGEPDYPTALAAAEDAPPILLLMGRSDLLNRPTVAIVGARNASTNGRRIARAIAAGVAVEGLAVASGMARGIDAAAHDGALDGGTVAVLAGGPDVVYPEENRGLYDSIRERGAILAESPPGLVPQARHFPRRTRSGLRRPQARRKRGRTPILVLARRFARSPKTDRKRSRHH